MFDALAFSYVPEMHHWVPASAHQYMIVDEFDAKHSVIMAGVVPLGGLACYSQTLSFFNIIINVHSS